MKIDNSENCLIAADIWLERSKKLIALWQKPPINVYKMRAFNIWLKLTHRIGLMATMYKLYKLSKPPKGFKKGRVFLEKCNEYEKTLQP